MNEASNLLDKTGAFTAEVEEIHQRLVVALNPKDPFLFRWRAICAKRGFLK
ncbi:MAG: hypothetical protein WA705_19645 [Candidatus Ozemobacteraceae bacterium]